MQIDINTQKITAIKAHREWVEQTFGFRTGLKQSKEAVELLATEKAEQERQERERKHRIDVAERIYWLLYDEGLAGTGKSEFPDKNAILARLFPSF